MAMVVVIISLPQLDTTSRLWHMVVAVFPYPILQAVLTGEHDGAGCRGPRVAQ
jgi:hypothetical protein